MRGAIDRRFGIDGRGLALGDGGLGLRDLLRPIACLELGEIGGGLIGLRAQLAQRVLEIDLVERGEFLALLHARALVDVERREAAGDLEADIDLPHLDIALQDERSA